MGQLIAWLSLSFLLSMILSKVGVWGVLKANGCSILRSVVGVGGSQGYGGPCWPPLFLRITYYSYYMGPESRFPSDAYYTDIAARFVSQKHQD
jgi:hypothetical protein